MWTHGAFLAAVAVVLLACSDGDRHGGQWYEHKSPPSSGAAGMGDESAGESGDAAGAPVDDSVGGASSER